MGFVVSERLLVAPTRAWTASGSAWAGPRRRLVIPRPTFLVSRHGRSRSRLRRPRYRPFDGRALQLASRGEVDAAVVVGYLDAVPAEMAAFVRTVPAVVIGPDASAMTLGQRCVAIDTGLAGVHDAGTVLRMDDVPLPARAVVPGPPAAAGVVKTLREAVVTGGQK